MRFLYKRISDKELQSHFEMVQDVVNSIYFVLIDLFLIGLFLSIFTMHVHQSIKLAIFIFIAFYVFGVTIYLLLRKWIKDGQK